ncbi:c-di-AMP phosphodiesterase, consists of a GGDEF-like and DHH domains [Alkalithermobacter thermoalcaliphilus JW-YL-7 = DSM 7308]|uniref:Cyclic-di-AMP phosphodiesterase n=1 Tax=Alkalithermobacter thermoalcaliphilus JW-YL-7 = DSM 7308 TaxID=1121328 RepID=A0A150FSY7_CLOPD|nr:phosphoesterase RecJ domain protein [[Clostridium] paradoxum JW-YL-7 = DSM 7308]SHL09423.1 c-di-AMP phosphodiesterase, consists of a GGDEF-like and DHH domains [[Clostridium] paradoxum JW-YL-7 = DSM 7308]
MKDKFGFKFYLPETSLYMCIILILSVIISVYNIYIGIASFICFCYLTYHNWKITDIRRKEWTRYIENLSIDMDEAVKNVILNIPIPLCILEFDGKINWYNNKFLNMMKKTDILEKNIESLVPNLNLRKVLNENKELYTEVEFDNKKYNVVYNIIKSEHESKAKYLVMVYWFDKTEYVNLLEKYKNERPVIAIIQVDSYDEVIQSASEDKRPLIAAEIERILNLWALQLKGAFRKNAKDKYTILISNKDLENLEKDKFSILDEIRKIDHGNTLPITLSIGVGAMGESLNETLRYANSALDLALGRGGDQAVIKRKEKAVFYGGKNKAVEKRTRVKARIIAHALKDLILESQQIFIMGHKYPDLDALGASIGIYSICMSLDKECNIILEKSNSSIESLMDRLIKSEKYKHAFISKEEAIRYADKNTLVIVVDTHRPNFTECEEILEISEKIVVIDHHRRGIEFIDNAVLVYHEPYESSTCEMVTEILQYIDEKSIIDKLGAEALLSGIILDTKNFTFKTGVRTFEAAAILRKLGADTVSVKKLFQGELDEFIGKAEIIKNSKIIANTVAISLCYDTNITSPVVIAQGADELLNIKGVKASFVLGKSEDNTIFISGRSLGDINVQVIMEKLGGGGHIDVAGAQLADISIEEALERVEELIMEYLKEAD